MHPLDRRTIESRVHDSRPPSPRGLHGWSRLRRDPLRTARSGAHSMPVLPERARTDAVGRRWIQTGTEEDYQVQMQMVVRHGVKVKLGYG